jgi:predicted nucleic acid-binding protein
MRNMANPVPISWPSIDKKRFGRTIFPAETASGLTKAERQRLIPSGNARPLLAKIVRTLPALYPYGKLLFRAIDISSTTRSSLNDCLYVALAERDQCELVTADDKLFRNLQPRFPFTVSLATLP